MDKVLVNIHKRLKELNASIELVGQKVKDKNHTHSLNQIDTLLDELTEIKARLNALENVGSGIKP